MRDSHLPDPDQDDDRPEDRPDDRAHRLKPMAPGPIAILAVIGLIGGWALHRIGDQQLTSTPDVGWVQVGVLWFLGAALAVTTVSTRRDLAAVPRRLTAPQAVNRLVMARTCALVGALVAGGYAGFTIGWIGTGAAELAAGRFLRSGLAALAGGVILIASVTLERACRAGSDGRDV